jgi:hypothetical protein
MTKRKKIPRPLKPGPKTPYRHRRLNRPRKLKKPLGTKPTAETG